MRIRAIRDWLPAIAWAAFLLASSGDAGSSAVTEGWFHRLAGGLGEDAVFYLNWGFRKSAHVVAYGLLGALNFRAIRGPRSGWRLRWSVLAVALAVAVAAIDEWQQTASALRTGALADVGFDTCGAALTQLFFRRGK